MSIEGNRVGWINATYITDDTDALAAEVGARLTEMQVQICERSGEISEGRGAVARHEAQARSCCATASRCPRRRGPARLTSCRTIATKLQSDYGKGKGTLDGKPINGSDIEAAMGDDPRSRPSSRRCGSAGTTMSARR